MRYVSGTVALYDGMLQMVHPDRVVDPKDFGKLPLVEPVYPLTEGLTVTQLRKSLAAALAQVPNLPEWQDAAWLARQKWPPFGAAIEALHRPNEPTDVQPDTPAWSRLAYDELLASQLALALVRAHVRRPAGRPRDRRRAAARAHHRRPALRADGVAAAGDRRDRRRPRDSRSACCGCCRATSARARPWSRCSPPRPSIEAARQAALMAPTELLARQHFAHHRAARRRGRRPFALLTGRERGRERAATLAAPGRRRRSTSSSARMRCSRRTSRSATSALAVVDEQHRFGVHQRLALAAQGRGRRRPGDDRDADPAHAGAHLFRRHGRLAAAREAGRPPADRHAHGCRLSRLDEVVDAVGARHREGQARLLGLPAGRGIRDARSGRRRGALRRCSRRASATASISCTAA